MRREIKNEKETNNINETMLPSKPVHEKPVNAIKTHSFENKNVNV